MKRLPGVSLTNNRPLFYIVHFIIRRTLEQPITLAFAILPLRNVQYWIAWKGDYEMTFAKSISKR